MAADKDIIKYSDLFDPEAVSQLAKEFDKVIPQVESSVKKMAVNLTKSLSGINFSGIDLKGLQKVNDEIKKANELSVLAARLKKAEAAAQIEVEKQNQQEIKTSKAQLDLDNKKQKTQEKKIQLTEKEIAQKQLDNQKKKDEIALLKATIVEMSKTAGWLQRIEAQNTRLRLERKKLVDTDKDYAANLKRINDTLDANNAKIIANSDKLKQQKLNVGNYTESINKAFEGTGLLGQTISQYLGIVENLAGKIEAVAQAIILQTTATEANTAATALNNAVEEVNLLTTEADTVATQANTVATEANTVAVNAQKNANTGLGQSLLSLAKNPYVLAAAAVAGLTEVLYANVTATDANRDRIKSLTDGVKAYVSTAAVAGVNSLAYAASVALLTDQLNELEDKQIDSIVAIQDARTASAQAREESAKEGVTIRERIELLDDVIAKSKEASRIQIELADATADAFDLFGKTAKAAGKDLSDEQRKQIQEARARASELREEEARELLKVTKQQTALIKEYYDETRKLQQDAQRQEIELIDTFSKYKAQQLVKENDKELKLLQVEREQAVENLKKKQKELGALGPDNIDRTEQFREEVDTLNRFYDAKEIETRRKTTEELKKINEDFRKQQIEAEAKYRSDLEKLDENYAKTANDIDKQQQDNELAQGQRDLNRIQEQITDAQNQRTEDIAKGKKKKNLTVPELKKYFDEIDRLNTEQFDRVKKQLQDEADFKKFTAKDDLQDEIEAIKERYKKLNEEEEKAIGNKTLSPAERQAEITTNRAKNAVREAEEIERVNRELAAEIALIDEKLKGDLAKADEDALKKQREVLEQKRKINQQTIADDKAAAKKLIDQAKKYSDQITEGIKRGLAIRADLQDQSNQRDIDRQARILEVQAQLAAAGQDNVLAETQARLDKAEEKRIQDQKRAAKQQENLAIIKTFSDTLQQALQSDKPFFQAFAEATAASGVVEAAFAKLFSGFYEGTESLGADGTVPFKNGKDDILVSAKKGERLIGYEDSKSISGLTNKEVVDAALAYKNNDFENIYVPQFKAANVSVTKTEEPRHNVVMTNVLRNEIRELRIAVENKPVSHTHLGALGEWTQAIEKRGLKTIIYHKRNRKSLRANG